MTFSVSGRCPRSGEFGIAVASSSPAVAARCAHARAGVGVVATQNVTDPRLGPQGLGLLEQGLPTEAALARLRAEAPHIEYRQLALLGREGPPACFSGARALGVHAEVVGRDCVALGNLLANPGVPARMVAAFEAMPEASLGTRLIAAMRAAVAAGGEAGPVFSAGLLVVRDQPWPIADLRVDWVEQEPIEALAKLWTLWEPQQEAYVNRALNPGAAPAYGVPGEL
ncbi:DUF1028 domain-containing protein [Siccirubricoccus sp. KC 17139]|uniref:DUF1028 domain-containing protein n=1 Tax=Siccirubricoccus soli TaxID=2899147 RepID=A0ABT1D9E9_9PROT|nr:DUF1028 domain-containing protein [Siccirubricoccus soli]MCO6417824.1 DUF1028 domain-containing protein [Siccirubricoccus soli]MCP2683959.1 DUF1028 domain-containing protein [Siccirubricoccus soli]